MEMGYNISIHIKAESFYICMLLSIKYFPCSYKKNPLYSKQQNFCIGKKIKHCCISLPENSNCASLKIATLTVTDKDNFFDRTNYKKEETWLQCFWLDIFWLLPLAASPWSLYHGRQYEFY